MFTDSHRSKRARTSSVSSSGNKTEVASPKAGSSRSVLSVQDSSLGPNDHPGSPSGKANEASSSNQSSPALNDIENQVRQEIEESMDNEETPKTSLLKSILAEQKQQGEMLAAFIASQHQFQRQITAEVSGIKQILQTEQNRFDHINIYVILLKPN